MIQVKPFSYEDLMKEEETESNMRRLVILYILNNYNSYYSGHSNSRKSYSFEDVNNLNLSDVLVSSCKNRTLTEFLSKDFIEKNFPYFSERIVSSIFSEKMDLIVPFIIENLSDEK